jgi:hypothetical protein
MAMVTLAQGMSFQGPSEGEEDSDELPGITGIIA